MKSSSRVLAVVLALVVAFSSVGCGRFARRGSGGEPSPAETVGYGGGVGKVPTTTGRKLGKTGTLRIRVIDDRRRVIVGAIVRYKGEKKGQMVTDARGVASVKVPQGNYTADIAPCGSRVVTKDYRVASVFVPRGGTAGGDLDEIRWERRFHPTESAKASPTAPWKVGDAVDIGVRVEDRCTFTEAKGVAIPEYAWKLSNFVLRKAPVMRASADGFAHISVSCKAAGNGTIEIYDRAFPKDSVDAISALSVPAGGNFCTG